MRALLGTEMEPARTVPTGRLLSKRVPFCRELFAWVL